ncbi:hypothetical protein [Ferruginibacter sp. HRS2-29]|uniref:hypothetical protein n=1 Tax=Ferruginibacter sp. HRS2-29 TaxID=2487334 RepID=UPI0020CD29EA|nr:hypothetical protein [Ferruginibacter sp. HRS2-29]
MNRLLFFFVILISASFSFAQKKERVYLSPSDSSSNKYIALIPDQVPIKAVMFFLDGFGASPAGVLIESDMPAYAAQQGILTILPVLKTGALYFGVDTASQASLKEQVEYIYKKYQLEGKPFYIGGFSIGGSCAVKYAELAVKNNYPVKPKAVFAVDPPLDFERFHENAKRVVRLSTDAPVNGEVTYMIDRIEKEMGGTPQTALENYFNTSPYSFNDTTQRAVKLLINTPITFITEPDIHWWMQNRGYDYSYINVSDLAAMINELQHLGNKNALLQTTVNKGFRKQTNTRHPHSLSIIDKEALIKWLMAQ